MTVNIPQSLLRVPPPWNHLDEYGVPEVACTTENVELSFEALASALDGIHALPKEAQLPSYLEQHWGFLARTLAQDMSTFSEFDIEKVAVLVRNQDESANDSVIAEAGYAWIRFCATSIAQGSLRWLSDAARQRPEIIERLNEFCRTRWRQGGDRLAYSMLLTVFTLDSERGRSLIEEAISQPGLSETLAAQLQRLT